jgi:vacuolar-type H+-ATPase subunit I/STV1
MGDRIAAVTFLALALGTIAYALPLRMYTAAGPGAGLFPLIIGILMAVSAIAWLAQGWRRTDEAARGRVERAALIRVVAQIAALAAFTIALETLGYVASAAGLITVTALINGERRWAWIAAVAVMGSIGLSSALSLLGTRL